MEDLVYCKYCEKFKPLVEFLKEKRNKNGYKNKCKQCQRDYNKKYILINKERISNNCKKYYDENRDELLEKQKVYDKIYFQKNKLDINVRRNKQMRDRRNTDPLYKLKCVARTKITSALKNLSLSKPFRTYEIIGCSYEEFKTYLESKFDTWMTWENFGKYNGKLNFGWDIDHIIPISSAETEEDVLKLSHYTNLQPLCSYTNRYVKKDKIWMKL